MPAAPPSPRRAFRAVVVAIIACAVVAAAACSGQSSRVGGTGGLAAGSGGSSATGGSNTGADGGTQTGGSSSGGDAGGPPSGGSPSSTGGASTAGTSSSGAGGTSGEGGAAMETGGASGTAGTAGTMDAGTPELTDPEFCQAACDATEGRYSLPQALCEDWRYPDFDVTPAYCEPTETRDCVDLCVERLTQVPSACHDVLRPAADCAAHDRLYAEGLATECVLSNCHPFLFRVSIECHGLRDELEAARARWASEGSENYSFRYTQDSEQATVEVTNGVPMVVDGTLPRIAATIPDQFALIEAGYDDGAPALIEYDPVLGYPTRVEFYPSICIPDGFYPNQVWSNSDLVLE